MSQVSDDLQFEHEKSSKGKQLVKEKKEKKEKVVPKLSNLSHIKLILGQDLKKEKKTWVFLCFFLSTLADIAHADYKMANCDFYVKHKL